MARYGRARSARGMRHRTSKRKSSKKRRTRTKRRQQRGGLSQGSQNRYQRLVAQQADGSPHPMNTSMTGPVVN